MRAIVVDEPGGPDVLDWREVADPEPGPGEALVEVVATAVNRADLMQRRGHYPPPAGSSPYPGLECSGRIVGFGPDPAGQDAASTGGWAIGDEVCALLSGGGYAERVTVPLGQLLPVPRGVSLPEAAALPEVACTVWANVFMVGGLRSGESFLVHGGGSGIGTFAIQLATAWGARVLTTAGSAQKLDQCRELGADVGINYRNEDFLVRVREETDGAGVDVILDIMGGSYLEHNVRSLAVGGRLTIIGLMGGRTAEVDLGRMLVRRLSIHATTLRSRPVEEKARIVDGVRTHVWPLVESAVVRPIVHSQLSLAEAATAHRVVESSEHVGKVLLQV